MSGFTKLVPEIIHSSIWNEPSDIRIVWITLLAVKDEHGYVQGDARTISRLANVPQDAAVQALEMFQKPDPYSHTPDDDGRRIAPAAGGWMILNHEKYRMRDHRQEHAEYVREWRKKRDVKKCESQVTHPSASASASVSVSEEDKSQREGEFDAFWKAYPKKIAKQAALKAWNKATKKPTIEVILSALEIQKKSEQWTKDDGQFIPHPATWLNAGRWDDEVIEKKPLKLFSMKGNL